MLSFQTVLVIDGHGLLMHRIYSTSLPSRTFPDCGSRMTGLMPKKGTVADLGLVSMAPGNGVI